MFYFSLFHRTSDVRASYPWKSLHYTVWSCNRERPCSKLQLHSLHILKPKGSWQTAEAGNCSTRCKSHMPKAPERHSLPLRGSQGRNNSGQTPLDSLALCFLPDVYKGDLHGCQTTTGHREPFFFFFFVPISLCSIWCRLFHGFCLDHWEPFFFQTPLFHRAKDIQVWLKQQSVQPGSELVNSNKHALHFPLCLLIYCLPQKDTANITLVSKLLPMWRWSAAMMLSPEHATSCAEYFLLNSSLV